MARPLRRAGWVRGVVWLRRMVVRAVVLAGVGSVAYGLGAWSAPPAARSDAEVSDAAQEFPVIEGLGGDYVRVGGKRVRVGEAINGFEILGVVPRRRVALAVRDDVVFVFKVGGGAPERLGPVSLVEARAERVLRGRTVGGSADGGRASEARGGVGSASGDVDGVPASGG